MDDPTEAIVLTAGKYNSPEPVTLAIRELVELIARVTGFTGEIRWDTSRAHDRFGFMGHSPWEEGLRRTIEWYGTGFVE